MALTKSLRSLLFLLVIAGCSLTARARADSVLNPKAYASPSGEYRLFVDPTAKDGGGAADYRFTRGEHELWSGRRDYTLWDATVTDDGVVAGYAYESGYDGWPARQDGSGLSVILLDPGGDVRMLDHRWRRPPSYFSTPPAPYVPLIDGLLVDSVNDRLIARISPRLGQSTHTWWAYRLSTGEKLRDMTPDRPENPQYGFSRVITAELVPGTPLTLVHWCVHRFQMQNKSTCSARFSLLDSDLKEIWRLDSTDEYAGLREYFSWWDLIRADVKQASVADGGFVVRLCKDAERIAFDVTRDAAAPAQWRVKETSRTPDSIAELLKKDAWVMPDVPEANLKHVGTIELGGREGPKPAIRDVGCFAIDGLGRIGFIRGVGAPNAPDFVLVDQTGVVLAEAPLESPDRYPSFLVGVTSDNRWIVTRNASRESPHGAWWVDTDKGELTSIDGLDPGRTQRIAPAPDGGFYLHAKGSTREGYKDEVTYFDRDGRRQWRIEPEANGRSFMIQDMAPRPEGGVALMTAAHKTLELYDAEGEHERSIRLSDVLNHIAHYPSELEADVNGGLILFDFGDRSTPVSRINAELQVTSRFRPLFPDGAARGILGKVRVAPDGVLWTTNKHNLLRLNEDGVVDLMLGAPKNDDSLDTIRELTVDHDGNIYALNLRTKHVHVLDQSGELIRMIRQTTAPIGGGRPTVAGNGDVYLQTGDRGMFDSRRFVRYSAEGERLGEASLGLDSFTETWLFQPGTQRRWVVGLDEVHLVDADGQVTQTFDRNPDRTWFQQITNQAVAPDGSLAVFSTPGFLSSSDGISTLGIFGPNGEPIATFTPDQFGMFHNFALTENFLCGAYENELRLMRIDTGEATRFDLPLEDGHASWWRLYVSPDGAEIWARNSDSMTIHRYRLPADSDE